MTTSTVPDAPERLKQIYVTLEPLAKVVVATVAGCYAIGLLIKNLYLARWTTFSAQLIDVEYVLSGALFGLIILMGLAHWSCSIGMIRRLKREDFLRGGNRSKIRTFVVRFRMTGVAVATTLVVAVILAFVYQGDIFSLDYILGIFTTVAVFPPLIFLAWRPIADMWRDFTVRKVVPGEAAMRAFFRLGLFTIVLFLFIEFIYPRVSPVYGGGRLTPVRVQVGNDAAEVLRNLRFKSFRGMQGTFEAELIFDDGKYLTLLAPSEGSIERTAVRIHHDDVRSVRTWSRSSIVSLLRVWVDHFR